MTTSYGRSVELYVDKLNFNGDDLTIYFDVPFDDDGDPNVAEVQIYNLKNETINGLKKDKRVVLNAGYVDDAGGILLGIIKDVKTHWSGVDRITTMQVLDGTDAWFQLPLKKSYAKNAKASDILNDITKMTGLQIGAIKLPTNRVYKSGKTVNGKLRDIIKQIAKECGAKAHVNRGKVFIRPRNEGNAIGFVLDTDHGLISSPTPVEREFETGQKDKKTKKPIKKKVSGWSVKCLLNHKITTDAVIQITSKTANGKFRVASGSHDGKNFETVMEVFPV